MLNHPYGPHGAEDENPEVWTELSLQPELLPDEFPQAADSLAGLAAQEPYSPAAAHGLCSTEESSEEMTDAFDSGSDPLGSWTGTPEDGGLPVQDQDDL